jgi:hypothetical protein
MAFLTRLVEELGTLPDGRLTGPLAVAFAVIVLATCTFVFLTT